MCAQPELATQSQGSHQKNHCLEMRMVHDHKEEDAPGEKTVGSTRHTLPTFYEPEGFSPVYSDNAVVMHTENEFILSFFLADFPYPSNTTVDVEDGEYEYASPVKSA